MRHRDEYPPAIRALLDGEEPERSEESRLALIMLAYMGWSQYPELDDAWYERARHELERWHDEEL